MTHEKKPLGSPKGSAFYITLCFVLVLVTWMAFLFIPQPNIADLPTAYGTCDISACNLDDTVYRTHIAWEAYPYQLYTPEDFANGMVTEFPQFSNEESAARASYATYRTRLVLLPNTRYGISMLTSDYAMRIYIEGKEIDAVGTPGNTKETTEHRVLEQTYHFDTQSDNVEIIVQSSNFVHNEGARAPQFVIGTSENITLRNNANLIVSYVVIGCLLSAVLHHIGLFFLNRQLGVNLIFAICCLMLALMNKRIILLFWPDYTFSVMIRIEYAIHFLAFATFILFLDKRHPQLMHKYVTRGYYSLSGLYLLTLFLDPLIFVEWAAFFELATIAIIIYALVRLAMSLRDKRAQNFLSFAGVLIIGAAGANDFLYYKNITIIPPLDGQLFMTPIGMVFFVFCYALAMSLDHAETERLMFDARAREERLAAENAALDRMNLLKKKLMSTMSHEARTPLAILATYAGLVSMELRDKGMDEQMTDDLDTIAFEAERVANLIDSIKQLTLSDAQVSERVPLNLSEIAIQTARLYQPILERGNVSLIIEEPERQPIVLGNPAEVTQVLFNLLENAKKHTQAGSITISFAFSDDFVTAYITDTGVGIAPHLLPIIFERGVTGGNGGSGIGLAVCKEIIESHGGTIQIESTVGKGTKVTVAYPLYAEGRDG